MYLDVRKSSHNLALGRKLGALLEFEIANRAGQSKVSVDTPEINKTTRSCDSVLFVYRLARSSRLADYHQRGSQRPSCR
jgi:hypothetical protein